MTQDYMRFVAPLLGAALLGALLLLVQTLAANAQQQQTIYGADGRVSARVTTDSGGASTIYGADGRVAGRTTTDSSGNIVVYDAEGRIASRITTSNRRSKP